MFHLARILLEVTIFEMARHSSAVDQKRRIEQLVAACSDKFLPLVQYLRQGGERHCVTLLHGDARAANYFLEESTSTTGSGVGVVAVDWQGFSYGSGPSELAYFLSMSVQVDVLSEHEDALIDLYHRTLVEEMQRKHENPNISFPLSDVLKQYYAGVATCLSVPLMTTGLIKDGLKYTHAPTAAPHMQALMHTSLRALEDIGPMHIRWINCALRHFEHIFAAINA